MHHLLILLLAGVTWLSAATPSIVITGPADGATVSPTFALSFAVTDWPMAPGDRHAHWTIDGVDQGPIYGTAPIAIQDLPVGTHSLGIDLRESDHSPTGVSDSITIQVEADRRLTARTIVAGLVKPVAVVSAPGEPDRLYVCEQHSGAVRVVDLDTGTIVEPPFLQVPDVSQAGEQGLLGLAFHPSYADNGQVFVSFNNSDGDTRIWRYDMLDDDPAAVEILALDQPQSNHNGGWIGFGQDGMFYIALGDGGGQDDLGPGHVPGGNAQHLGNLYGSILRIDVDGGSPYAIPADNPFTGIEGARGEIWVSGLRNPWRCAFDPATTALWIGDVGQTAREEIDRVPGGFAGGLNFGWPAREGFASGPQEALEPEPDFTDPVWDYPRTTGRTVIGGAVYRGPIPDLRGRYFFADYPTSKFWHIPAEGQVIAATEFTSDLDETSGAIDDPASFGTDDEGHLYICSRAGLLYRLEPDSHRRISITIDPAPEIDTVSATDRYDSFTLDNGTATFAWRRTGSTTTITFGDVMALGQLPLPRPNDLSRCR